MITVINKTNKGLYNQLFHDVSQWLSTHDAEGNEVENQYGEDALLGLVKEKIRDPITNNIIETENMVPDTITSLEELFSFMRPLTRSDDACIYTRLPLDEEPFFIDANARTITVPTDFAKNGISVQGDEIAEILFFKINRFFDATDLNNCKIYIQWKSSETDEFGNQKEGVSRPWIQDIESEPGYLIFGWPISSKITKAAGTVTFSVRFYRLDEADKLVYSFSTLDQTVTIKPALDYDIEDIVNDTSSIMIDDTNTTIRNRAKNSIPSDSAMAAEMPYWEDGIEEGLKGWTTVKRTDDSIRYEVMNLNTDENGFSTVPVELYTAALSNDSGVVSLSWVKTDKNGVLKDTLANDETRKFYENVFYRITDVTEENRIEHKTYYVQEGNKYRAVRSEESLNDLREQEKDIYELGSRAFLDEIGKYIARAENRVGKVFSEPLTSTPIYVPAPVAPELTELVASAETGPILEEEHPVTLGLDVTLKDEFGNNVAGKGGKATYEWHRRLLGTQVPLENSVGSNANLILTSPDEDEGYYSVTVTNNLNKAAESTESNEIRITKPAVKPILSIATEDDISLSSARANGLTVTVSGLEPAENREDIEDGGTDTVTYQWYKYYSDGHNVDQDKEDAKNGRYEIHSDKKISELTGAGDLLTEEVLSSALSEKLTPPINGVYFCVVTNIYNGTETSAISPFYNVVD